MLSKILSFSALASTVLGQTAGNVGSAFSLNNAVIMQAKDVYMDTILSHLAYVQLPDWHDGKNYATGNYFTI